MLPEQSRLNWTASKINDYSLPATLWPRVINNHDGDGQRNVRSSGVGLSLAVASEADSEQKWKQIFLLLVGNLSVGRPCPWGCIFGGVYVPCMFMYKPWKWGATTRRILRILYKDHVTNEEVRAKIQLAIGLHEDLTIVKRRKLQWYGHVSRSSGLAKTILLGTVKGTRQGWERMRREDNIGD